MKTEDKRELATDGVGKRRILPPKPKDWAFVTKSEGRKGKPKRAKEIKLKDCVMASNILLNTLLQSVQLGHPLSRWTVTMENPMRVPTSNDAVRIYVWLAKLPLSEYVELKWNPTARVMHITEDLTRILD